MSGVTVVTTPQRIVADPASGSAMVIARTQQVVVDPSKSSAFVVSKTYHIDVDSSSRIVTVESVLQSIVVNAPAYSVSVTNAGPMGPRGAVGPSEPALLLLTPGDLLTNTAGVVSAITRSALAADAAFTAGLTAHVAAADPHPVYTTAAELTAGVNSGVATHVGLADPHPVYTTAAELTAGVNSGIATHVGLADPHPVYTTAAELTTGVNSGIATHAAASDPHTVYVKKAGDTMTGNLVLTGKEIDWAGTKLKSGGSQGINIVPLYDTSINLRVGSVQGYAGITPESTGSMALVAGSAGALYLTARGRNPYSTTSYVSIDDLLEAGRSNGGGSGADWNTMQLRLKETGGYSTTGNVGMAGWLPLKYWAPLWRVNAANGVGERWDSVNNSNSSYARIAASGYDTISTMREKSDIVDVADADLLSRLSIVHTHAWTPRVRPQDVHLSEKFTTIAKRWVDTGHTPLIPKPEHADGSIDHDCALADCLGDGTHNCTIIQNFETGAMGLVAEEHYLAFPEHVNLDVEGIPHSIDTSQVAATALGAVGALTRVIQELTDRIAALEAKLNK